METNLKKLLEAVLLTSDKPLSEDQLLKLFSQEEKPTLAELRKGLKALEADSADRGIELVKVASGYRFQSKKEWGDWITRLWEEKPQKYSRATLETLALIAYRQPITRGEIEAIRGVAVSTYTIRTLEEREWVRVVGHKEVPGRPALYATTREFLNYFNLNSLKDLPLLPEVMDLDSVELGPEFTEDELPAELNSEEVEEDEVLEEVLEEELAVVDGDA